MTCTPEQLKEILCKHKNWTLGKCEDAERVDLRDTDLSSADLHDANLCGADLSGANLYGANLCGANLYSADVRGANLRGASLSSANLCGATLYYADVRGANLYGAGMRGTNLRGANLSGADMRGADLRGANLYGADMRGADLRGANLSGANLCSANLEDIKWNISSAFYPLQCPESGSFVGWKKASERIVKLEICEDALRSSATSRKCRCSKAKVLGIENIDGSPAEVVQISSNYDRSFVYRIGETVEVSDFDTNRWNECTSGIHFFITREEAVKY